MEQWKKFNALEKATMACKHLFSMERIDKMRGEQHTFRYSMKTDGYGAALYFSPTQPSTFITSESPEKRQREEKNLLELEPGIPWDSVHMDITLDSKNLEKTTIRAIDPGVTNTYCSVDLLVPEVDVRTTSLKLKTSDWRKRIKTKKFTEKQSKWYAYNLAHVQQELTDKPYGKSSYLERYIQHVDVIYTHWKQIWKHYNMLKIRKLRFRMKKVQQRELDREINKICKPREGDNKTILLMGNAAKHGISVRRRIQGPCKKIFDQCVRKKKGCGRVGR